MGSICFCSCLWSRRCLQTSSVRGTLLGIPRLQPTCSHSHHRALGASPCLSWREMSCSCKVQLLLHDSQVKVTAAPSDTKSAMAGGGLIDIWGYRRLVFSTMLLHSSWLKSPAIFRASCLLFYFKISPFVFILL